MNKKTLLRLSLVGAMLLAAGCAGQNSSSQSPYYSDSGMSRPSRAEIENRILQELEDLGETELAAIERSGQLQNRGSVSSDFPITINERVEYFITYYQTKMPDRFTRYLNRSGRYDTMMREILKEYGLPEDLFYLALIESGFTNTATSHAGAGGPWQFMPATARRFGLRVDSWVDERRDPVKATHAAAQYLRFLYGEFGSWYLAAAGYNAGENKIRRALTMYGVDDFWNISRSDQNYLAEETKQYVPRMIAAAIIAKEPEKYGFTNVKYEPPFTYDELSIHPTSSLAAIAKVAGIPTSVLVDLNPELKRAASPPGGMYTLRIPNGSYAKISQAYASLTPEQRTAQMPASTYSVARGDTLGAIARRHGCSLAQLYAANPRLNRNSVLNVGQTINLPGSARDDVQVASSRNTASTTSNNIQPVSYQVRGGDTVSSIAQRNNCSVTQLYAMNPSLNNKPNIRAGQNLRVPGRAPAPQPTTVASNRNNTASTNAATTYKVQNGDTLGVIAQRHNTTTAQLYAMNPSLNNKPNIKVGQTLTVTGRASQPATVASTRSNTNAAVATTTYKVQSGDTLGGIAQRHNTTTTQLYAMNPSLNNKPNIRVGQTLTVNGSATVAAGNSTKPVLVSGNTRTVTHQVQRGDTIYSLARSYNISAQDISKQLGRQTLYAGEKLTLNVPASRAEARSGTASRVASREEARFYVVQSGDTLWSLSSRFNVSVNDIKRINNLRNDNLSVGTKLQLR